MASNTLAVKQRTRLHDKATTLPVPSAPPIAAESVFGSLQARDATLVMTGTATSVTGPISIYGHVDYTTDSGVASNEAVEAWIEQDVLSTTTISLPKTFSASKLSPAFDAYRVVAAGVVGGNVSIDLLVEQGPD
jgi:hypothetical protein